MSWFAVWETTTGRLVSTGTVLANPLPGGLSSFDFGTPQTGIWNTTTHVFDPAPTLHSVLTPKQFWDRWTPAERESLANLYFTGTQAQKNAIDAFRNYVHDAGVVDCNDSYIQTKVQQCETIGVLTAGRAAVILT